MLHLLCSCCSGSNTSFVQQNLYSDNDDQLMPNVTEHSFQVKILFMNNSSFTKTYGFQDQNIGINITDVRRQTKFTVQNFEEGICTNIKYTHCYIVLHSYVNALTYKHV